MFLRFLLPASPNNEPTVANSNPKIPALFSFSPVCGKVSSFVELTVVWFSSVSSVVSVETFSGVAELLRTAFSSGVTPELAVFPPALPELPDLPGLFSPCGGTSRSSSSSGRGGVAGSSGYGSSGSGSGVGVGSGSGVGVELTV